MKASGKKSLVVIASTYPRWSDDTVPSFVQEFVNRIASQFRSIRVVVPHYKGAARRERASNGVQVTRFRYAYPYGLQNIAYGEFKKDRLYPLKAAAYIASELLATARACLSSRPCVISAHWLIPQGFVAVILRQIFGIKVVVSIHGADVFTLNGRFMRKLKRFVLKHADTVVANSTATRDVCMELYKRDYPVIPMGIDMRRFKPRQEQTGGGTFRLLFVGRLIREKGILDVCAAVKLLAARRHDVHLTVVGDGPLREEVRQYVDQAGLAKVVTLHGWVQPGEIQAYYQRADAFVGPSQQGKTGWREAFGLVFVEAAASGLPIITTNTGGITDIVHDGVTGLLVPPADPEAIAATVSKLMGDHALARRLGDQAAAFVRDRYSWELTIRRYSEIFGRL